MVVSGDSLQVSAVPSGVGDAVGVEKRKWYVAIVNHNTEKVSSERLEKLGYHSYVAVQDELRVWKNGRKAVITRVVIPSVVFIRCSEKERRHIVTLPYINRFMTDKAGMTGAGDRKPLAVIPDRQIHLLRFMLGNSDTPVSVSGDYQKGDRVRVVRGRLAGLEGEVITVSGGRSELIVGLGVFGCARLTIDLINVERIG